MFLKTLAAAVLLTAPLLCAAPSLTVNGLEANYTTTKLFVDEIAGTSIPLEIVLNPDEAGPITAAEIFTNLNNRDRANKDANGDGVHDGIQPPSGDLVVAGNDIHYYSAIALSSGSGGNYTGTINARKTGAYRLTARWKVQGDNNWRYYSDLSKGRRDHAITVSPTDARDISLYEINTLTIEAKEGPGQFIERSTFEDLHDAPGAPRTADGKGFNLDYLSNLGVNWLWFQPVHPAGIDGREIDPSTNQAYNPGSPYAVKNFFEINPWMSASYDGSSDISSAANRAAAMVSFQNFTAAADAKQIGVMLDAPFNHTSYDVELAEPGVELFQRDGDSVSPTTEIRNYEARFFSQMENYAERASNSGNIAIAPDRNDFGKFVDTYDVYFGRYASLVATTANTDDYKSEQDWFAYDDFNWTNADFTQGGVGKNVTKQVWRYFAEYALHWLEKTGYPEGTPHTEANRHLGIDGLRCDFGQGLPPQAWEYISNVARERKWNFVMMTESLDGGAVTYRSNRHFDILNENIVFPLKDATTAGDYRGIFDSRRSQYSDALVLTNSTSHDEENYVDPFAALTRYAVTNTVQGTPMVFMGQELGISRTFGFTFYETNFGKQIGHFKKFNSLQPLWDDTTFANNQLFPAYSAMGQARRNSPALRSVNEFYLAGDGGNDRIHAIAKYSAPGNPPSRQDVVLAFANVDRDAAPADNFVIPSALASNIGIKPARKYDVKNIAAFDPSRRDDFLWPGGGYTGAELTSNGVFVAMNSVPTSDSAWMTAPYEAQYLRLFDVTPPPAPDAPVPAAAFAIGTSATFSWTTFAFTNDDVAVSFLVNGTETTGTNSITLSGNIGDTLTAYVAATTPAGVTGPASASSIPVKLLAPDGDEDGDGQSNAAEQIAGTNPFSAASVFQITSFSNDSTGTTLTTNSVSGKTYRLWTSTTLREDDWSPIGTPQTGTGEPLTFSHTPASSDPKRFYRVAVE